jgi:hypothetical protein
MTTALGSRGVNRRWVLRRTCSEESILECIERRYIDAGISISRVLKLRKMALTKAALEEAGAGGSLGGACRLWQQRWRLVRALSCASHWKAVTSWASANFRFHNPTQNRHTRHHTLPLLPHSFTLHQQSSTQYVNAPICSPSPRHHPRGPSRSHPSTCPPFTCANLRSPLTVSKKASSAIAIRPCCFHHGQSTIHQAGTITLQ